MFILTKSMGHEKHMVILVGLKGHRKWMGIYLFIILFKF
jgi:hypothetical protein